MLLCSEVLTVFLGILVANVLKHRLEVLSVWQGMVTASCQNGQHYEVGCQVSE